MASKTHIRLIIFVLFLSNILSTTFSSLQTTYLQREEKNLRNWISWNLQNYQNKKKAANFQSAESQFSQERATNIGEVRLHLDMKLQIAEMNKRIIVVSQDGTGDFKTINEAIDTIPLHNTRRLILDIKPGIYREKITIPKTMAFVTLLGNSSDPPTITGNDTASVTGRDGMPLKTFQSATVAVDADYFVAINLKFENTAPHVVGVLGGQAVALRISGTKAAFYNCSFYGSQDTLYDHKGVHYFNNCFIQGSVDFIFGYARSLYENCVLNSVAKKVASLTAQKRSKTSMSSGFSFKSCNITGSGQVYLGRAWGDYSRVVFSYSYMDNIVLPQGWSDWGKRSRDRKVYYGEYKCSGPGANLSGRVPWAHVLSDEEAMPFIGSYYVDGETWLIDPLGS